MTLTMWNCVQRTNIQNLKAIHNPPGLAPYGGELCSKNEYTKSESNSQHAPRGTAALSNCVQRTNIQNLKAIHNASMVLPSEEVLCSKNEYTKSESNSQLITGYANIDYHCVQRTNIQNLKAIHNLLDYLGFKAGIVFKERIYKI